MIVEQGFRPIPNRLKVHRKRMRYRQRQVATLLGLYDTRPIYEWEKGLAMPGAANLIRLCVIYRTYANELYPELFTQYRDELKALELRLFAGE
ncbi:transcriptional regulator with XRE-family HTH domain [Mucilaginibacter sp. HD30]